MASNLIKRTAGIVSCSFVLLVFLMKFAVSRTPMTFFDFLYKDVAHRNTRKLSDRCAVWWLFTDAVAERDAVRIVDSFVQANRLFANLRLGAKQAIAVFEAAVWLRRRNIADSILEMIAVGNVALRGERSVDRLKQLYDWRFTGNQLGARKLLSPLMPHEAQLSYVDYYARATVADSLRKYDDALRFYRMALQSMPVVCEEAKRAEDACNFILKQRAESSSESRDPSR